MFSGRSISLVLLISLALSGFACALDCQSWDVLEDVPLLGGVGRVNALGLRYHPYNPALGAIDENTYIAWQLGNVEESDASINMLHKCDLEDKYPSEAGAKVWRSLNIGDLDCSFTRGSREIGPGVTLTYVVVNATWSVHPDFHMALEVSAVSSNYTVHNGASNKTDGLEYDIKYKPHQLKTNLIVENWPWAGPNGTSFLVASFRGALQAHDGVGNLSWVVGQEESMISMNTSRYEIRMENAHFLTLDDKPVLKTFAPYLYRSRGPLEGETPAGFFFPFSVCRDNDDEVLPHWKRAVYDPQFSSLFIGDGVSNPEQAPLISPGEKRNKKTVAIAAGTVFGIVGVGIAAAAVYFVFFYTPMAERGTTLG